MAAVRQQSIDLPLTVRSITIGNRAYAIHAVDDEDALLRHAEVADPFPFGLLLWESAVALADRLAEQSDIVAGRRVLEIGCGVGLTGIVAASLGAQVTAVDHDPAALDLARRNAAANIRSGGGQAGGQFGGLSGIRHQRADWHSWSDIGVFDVVIGADVVYDRASHAALLAILQRTLDAGGIALLTDPDRHEQPAFVDLARRSGFRVESRRLAAADLRNPDTKRPITLLTLDTSAGVTRP
jgi:predicted nicotinamide N-methyase